MDVTRAREREKGHTHAEKFVFNSCRVCKDSILEERVLFLPLSRAFLYLNARARAAEKEKFLREWAIYLSAVISRIFMMGGSEGLAACLF